MKALCTAFIVSDKRECDRDYGNPVPSFGPAPDALLEGFRQMADRIEVHVISCTQRPMAAPEMLAGNIRFHSLQVPKWGWLRSGYLGCVRAIRDRVRDIRPDLVHGQGTERECALGAVFSGFPNVVTIHGNMRGMMGSTRGLFSRLYYTAAALLEHVALGNTEGVLCNSSYTERMVGSRCRQTWRVPNAVRPVFFEGMERAPEKKTGRPVLLNVGTIAPHKRQVELLEALRRRHPNGAGYDVVFAGDMNASHPYARRFLELINTSPSCHYAGCLGAGEVRDLMRSAQGMVHCTREEAFGLVLAEAMACGLAEFGFDVGGAPDVVAGVDQGGVVPNGDWSGLLETVEDWLVRGAPAPANGRALARERYSPAAVAGRHLEIYQELINAAAAGKMSRAGEEN